MSVRIRLEATSIHPALSTPEAMLEHITPLAQAAVRAFGMGPVMASQRSDDSAFIHAMCFRGFEPLAITWQQHGRIAAEARTAAMGPGYHQHLCDHVLPTLAAQLDLRWTNPHPEACFDESGYFFERDRAALEDAHRKWLTGICSHMADLENTEDVIHLAMPLNPLFVADAYLITPQGPRDEAWARAVGEGKSDGRDFFTWWEAGETPATRLALARWLMWSQVAWRAPLDDDDTQINELVLRLLSEAHADAPELEYPWAEWAELAAIAGAEPPPVKPEADSKPTIGYRRGQMRVHVLDGWQLRIPGALQMEIDDDGNWSARDNTRLVQLQIMAVENADNEYVVRRPEGIEGDTVPREDDLPGEAVINDAELNGVALRNDSLAMINVRFEGKAGREWALDVWHSLNRPSDHE